MRVAISGHNISVDLADEWVLQDGYDKPSVQQLHGLYLSSRSHGLDAHVRAYGAAGHSLDDEGLHALLRDHGAGWFDEATRLVGPLTIVAASYETEALGGKVVREFFITDGKAVANVAAIGSRESLLGGEATIDALVASLRFEAERA